MTVTLPTDLRTLTAALGPARPIIVIDGEPQTLHDEPAIQVQGSIWLLEAVG